MPESGADHVLDGSFLPVGKYNLCYLLADARTLTAYRARLLFAFTRAFAANRAGLWRPSFALAGIKAALRAWLFYFTRRHGDEQAACAFDDFYVSDHKGVVKSDCGVGFQFFIRRIL